MMTSSSKRTFNLSIYDPSFLIFVSTNQNFHLLNDYENIRDRLEDAKKGFLENESTYENPCTLMIISIRAKDETKMARQGSTHLLSDLLGSAKSKVLNLQFRYYQDFYREIINYQAYTGETLLGQVGGFVGIQNQL